MNKTTTVTGKEEKECLLHFTEDYIHIRMHFKKSILKIRICMHFQSEPLCPVPPKNSTVDVDEIREAAAYLHLGLHELGGLVVQFGEDGLKLRVDDFPVGW